MLRIRFGMMIVGNSRYEKRQPPQDKYRTLEKLWLTSLWYTEILMKASFAIIIVIIA